MFDLKENVMAGPSGRMSAFADGAGHLSPVRIPHETPGSSPGVTMLRGYSAACFGFGRFATAVS